MFTGCTSLVGGNKTGYSPSYIDKTYARIDGKLGLPGYLTLKGSTTTYVLKKGPDFNVLVPKTATSIMFTDATAPANATLIDVDADGDKGVVGWLDGTTFKVSTQKPGQKVIANADSSNMFSTVNPDNDGTTMAKMTSFFGMDKLDTSGVLSMKQMFDGTASIGISSFSLDLSS